MIRLFFYVFFVVPAKLFGLVMGFIGRSIGAVAGLVALPFKALGMLLKLVLLPFKIITWPIRKLC